MLPLEGVRVIDLGQAWAGATVTRLLADMGAEVIKVESRVRMDLRGALRPQPGSGLYPNNDPGERPWNRAGMFNERHRGKLGITIELNTAQGKDLFKRIATVCDAVIENFSAGVMKRLGLDYDVLRDVNPRLVMVSMPGFGRTGPERDYVSYGPTIEQLSGIASITGYPDGPPMNSMVHFADPISGVLAMGAVLTGILAARRTGAGSYIELAQREATTRLIGDILMEYSMNRSIPPRYGNEHQSMAPHGCYPCSGEDKWITIAVSSDAEWTALCKVMERADLADDPRFCHVFTRYNRRAELDEILSAWTATKEAIELTHQLQAAGVAAGAVLNVRENWDDPQLQERGFFEEVDHPEAGPMRLFGMAWNMPEMQPHLRGPAPTLGQHNEQVLRELLHLSDQEIRELEAAGVVGTEPVMSDR